ncbi:MAG: hypothetical protein BGO69_18250 [Bacteroidetes bacterium 46-16]|nr:MAG: hypothetical protein BGO69_18250 [Bacteroidetes bacterium 46-16]
MRIAISLLLLFVAIIKCNAQSTSTIHYGVYVKNIMLEERAKEKSNRFTIDFYWWMRYKMPKDSSLMKEIENIEFVNGDNLENEIDERNFFYDSLTGEQKVYVTGHMKGDFVFYPNYHYYPLDKLVLPIIVESKNLVSERYQLVADTASYEKSAEHILGIADDIEIPSFTITGSRYQNGEKIYETNFGDLRFQTHLKYSRLNFEIILERKSVTFLLKILIPIILITLMAYLVFFVPAAQLEVAVGLTVTSLLSCIALQLTLSGEIPVTGYLIASDKIFYLSYFLITCAMIQTVYTFNLQKRKKERFADQLEVAARWIYPIIFIILVSFIIIKGTLSEP